jgi:hypothetical protein
LAPAEFYLSTKKPFVAAGCRSWQPKAEAMATNPRAATYRAFERSLREVQEFGVQIESETIIRIASAFMRRPHVGLGKPGK